MLGTIGGIDLLAALFGGGAAAIIANIKGKTAAGPEEAAAIKAALDKLQAVADKGIADLKKALT
jgi:hypothetical protein